MCDALREHEDPSSVSRAHVKAGMMVYTCNLALRCGRDRQMLWAHWPVSLAKMVK